MSQFVYCAVHGTTDTHSTGPRSELTSDTVEPNSLTVLLQPYHAQGVDHKLDIQT